MSASTVALIGALCYSHRELLPVLSAHLDENDGEVLPHLVLSDVVRWLVDHRDNQEACAAAWSWLEDAYLQGDEDEKDLVVVSGVEMIPDPDEPGSEFRELLGPELRAMDPWLRNFGGGQG